jgi:alkylation response protein AidB-like acyl-CoA dehydrogenase
LGATDPARELEAFLGDPLRPEGPLTYRQAVLDDQGERFPAASLDLLRDWGYSEYQVPQAFGGRLTSLEELLALGRVVARRDPAVALIANSPFGAATPVWLAGTPSHQREVARAIRAGDRVALGLTEQDHGADLLASEVIGRRTEAGYVVSGAKWLINNIRLARYVCLGVREPERAGLRSLSLLLVDLRELPPSTYELSAKIPTHGVRGADIAGIRFHDAFVPESAVIGRPGRGLELAAASLLVTRTLVPCLSLGVLDTALHCTVDFLRKRRLYGELAIDIPFVRDELAAALLDLSVAEVVAGCCVRVLDFLPELAPVSAAVAKYLVPHLVEARMRKLATVLGARYFLGEDHWFGIFEKLQRDVRLFSLFDGSEPIVLSALAAQATCLTEPGTDPRRADALFDRGQAEPARNGLGPFETVADEDPVTAGLDEACVALNRVGLRDAADLLRTHGQELHNRAGTAVDPRSLAGQRLGEQYARLFAAVCLARSWAPSARGVPAGAGQLPAEWLKAEWLKAGLVSLLGTGYSRMPRNTSRSLFMELLRRCSEPRPDLATFAPAGR